MPDRNPTLVAIFVHCSAKQHLFRRAGGDSRSHAAGEGEGGDSAGVRLLLPHHPPQALLFLTISIMDQHSQLLGEELRRLVWEPAYADTTLVCADGSLHLNRGFAAVFLQAALGQSSR
jgi:hypothetical protein